MVALGGYTFFQAYQNVLLESFPIAPINITLFQMIKNKIGLSLLFNGTVSLPLVLIPS